MFHLKLLLGDIGVVSFDEKKNYIRCFAHVINLCSQAVIKVMKKDNEDPAYSDTETEPATESGDSEDGEPTMRATRYTRKAGPITRARKTVAFIRKSGQRRDELQNIITEGNTKSLWREVTLGDDGEAVETTVDSLFSNLQYGQLMCSISDSLVTRNSSR